MGGGSSVEVIFDQLKNMKHLGNQLYRCVWSLSCVLRHLVQFKSERRHVYMTYIYRNPVYSNAAKYL